MLRLLMGSGTNAYQESSYMVDRNRRTGSCSGQAGCCRGFLLHRKSVLGAKDSGAGLQRAIEASTSLLTRQLRQLSKWRKARVGKVGILGELREPPPGHVLESILPLRT